MSLMHFVGFFSKFWDRGSLKLLAKQIHCMKCVPYKWLDYHLRNRKNMSLLTESHEILESSVV